MDAGQLDEAQNRMCRNGAAGFVVVQRPERDSQGFGQQRTAVFPVESDADLAESHREIALDRLPVGVGRNFVHQWRRSCLVQVQTTKPAERSAQSHSDYVPETDLNSRVRGRQ